VLDFLLNTKKCNHPKVSPDAGQGFCPDCGQEVRFSWKLLRCECCSTKRKAKFLKDNIVPEEKFCRKCGTPEYFIELKDKMEFFDYEYAVLQKEEVKQVSKLKESFQIWIEEENYRDIFDKPKLLPAF
jgi:hypothetical protein